METATQAFLITVAIVAGILSPILLAGFLFSLIGALNTAAASIIKYTEELKRKPPFEDVGVNVNPATNVMTVRLIKSGEVLWQGASSRREMTDSETLTFTQEKPNA